MARSKSASDAKSASAFREQRLSPDAVQRVLLRAAELTDGEVPLTGSALSRAELERRLVELGIASDVVERAMAAEDPEELHEDVESEDEDDDEQLRAPVRAVAKGTVWRVDATRAVPV